MTQCIKANSNNPETRTDKKKNIFPPALSIGTLFYNIDTSTQKALSHVPQAMDLHL